MRRSCCDPYTYTLSKRGTVASSFHASGVAALRTADEPQAVRSIARCWATSLAGLLTEMKTSSTISLESGWSRAHRWGPGVPSSPRDIPDGALHPQQVRSLMPMYVRNPCKERSDGPLIVVVPFSAQYDGNRSLAEARECGRTFHRKSTVPSVLGS